MSEIHGARLDARSCEVLLVDADFQARETARALLEAWGHRVHVGTSGAELERLRLPRADLVLIDPSEPGGAGWPALRRLRAAARSTPVLAALPGDEPFDRVLALESGADAVIAKPLDPRELRARLGSLLGRDTGANSLQFGRWRLDGSARRLFGPGGFSTGLSVAEYRMLRAFLERPHSVLLREELYELVGDHTEPEEGSRRIDLVVSRLRHKLDDDARRPRLIHTVRGLGYLFDSGALGQPVMTKDAAV
ncbi:MAG: response regulator transcription factor [Pelomonas sp.]|nr:response regulator transcription factor [Roseateles sp.]